jgi:selenide,water dikinase
MIEFSSIPLLPGASDLAAAGIVTGASSRNWASYGQQVDPTADDADVERALLTDPQTSGGLLVACAPDAVDAVLAVFRTQGHDRAAVIGEVTQSAPRVVVR